MTFSTNTNPLIWQLATIERIVTETYRARTFTFRLSEWRPFLAGQHYDVRLTAPDGYQAQRSYSIASSPETEGLIDLTIEVIPDGEVSPYFHEVAQAGDEIELRGPIGGPFTWSPDMGGPLLLVAGGSGVVPIMSMVRHRSSAAPHVPAIMLYSSRSLDDVIYREELERRAETDSGLIVLQTLTRVRPDGWKGYSRRVDASMITDALQRLDGTPLVYVCGPTPFVEAVADILVSLRVPPQRVHTERFGPTGS